MRRHTSQIKDLRIGSWNVFRKKAEGKTKTKMGRRRDGGCQEVGGEKLEECGKEYGQLAEASKQGLGSKRAVVR